MASEQAETTASEAPKSLDDTEPLAPLFVLDGSTPIQWGHHSLYGALRDPARDAMCLPAAVQHCLAEKPCESVLDQMRDILKNEQDVPLGRVLADLIEELEITIKPPRWGESLSQYKDFHHLPLQFRTYVHRAPSLNLLQEMMGVVKRMYAEPAHRPFCNIVEAMYEHLAQLDGVKTMYDALEDPALRRQLAALYEELAKKEKKKVEAEAKAREPDAKPRPIVHFPPNCGLIKRKNAVTEAPLVDEPPRKNRKLVFRRKKTLLDSDSDDDQPKPRPAPKPFGRRRRKRKALQDDELTDGYDLDDILCPVEKFFKAPITVDKNWTFEQVMQRLLDLKTDGLRTDLDSLVQSIMENRNGFTETEMGYLISLAFGE